jgi:hypothetical protein
VQAEEQVLCSAALNKCRRSHHKLLHMDAEDETGLRTAGWAELAELVELAELPKMAEPLKLAELPKLAKPPLPAESPSGPTESLACDNTRTAVVGVMLAQAGGEQGEAELCEMPLPWEEGYDDMLSRRGQPAEPRG